jgi:hypothetical protein
MNIKFFLAVVAALVTGFVAGGLIYGVLLSDFFKSMMSQFPPGVIKDPPAMWGIILGNLSLAILVTWIFNSTNVTKFMNGFFKGLFVGILTSTFFDFFTVATMNFTSVSGFIVDMLCSTCIMGLMGGVSALVLGSGKK